jgi:hypothetical protein
MYPLGAVARSKLMQVSLSTFGATVVAPTYPLPALVTRIPSIAPVAASVENTAANPDPQLAGAPSVAS